MQQWAWDLQADLGVSGLRNFKNHCSTLLCYAYMRWRVDVFKQRLTRDLSSKGDDYGTQQHACEWQAGMGTGRVWNWIYDYKSVHARVSFYVCSSYVNSGICIQPISTKFSIRAGKFSFCAADATNDILLLLILTPWADTVSCQLCKCAFRWIVLVFLHICHTV